MNLFSRIGMVWIAAAAGLIPARILCAAELFVPAQYRTIQAAINAASDGDKIVVASGTYQEKFKIQGKGVSVIGAGGAEQTLIDGARQTSSAPLVSIVGPSKSPVGLEGLTFCNASHGAIHCENASLKVLSCVVCGTTGWKSGVRLETGTSVWIGCAFLENKTLIPSQAGAVHQTGWVGAEFLATFIDCLFFGNQSQGSGFQPGAVKSHSAQFARCDFIGNSGNVAAVAVDKKASFSECQFLQNPRGGLYTALQASVVVDSCVFADNTNDFEYVGGAAILNEGHLDVSGTQFISNVAAGEGGAVIVREGGSLKASCCLFEGNHGRSGGGIVSFAPNTLIESCQFFENSADLYAGGVALAYKPGNIIKDCVLTGNGAGVACGGLYSTGTVTVVEGTTICDNMPQNLVGTWMDLGGNEVCWSYVPADFNGDGKVNGADLGILLSEWGPGESIADIAPDGSVWQIDLEVFLSAWAP